MSEGTVSNATIMFTCTANRALKCHKLPLQDCFGRDSRKVLFFNLFGEECRFSSFDTIFRILTLRALTVWIGMRKVTGHTSRNHSRQQQHAYYGTDDNLSRKGVIVTGTFKAHVKVEKGAATRFQM